MLDIWFSLGYILLLAIILFAVIHWRLGSIVTCLAALIIGIPLWFWWEYSRPTWTTGTVSGTEVRRSDPNQQGNTRDIQYIYMRNLADAGMELENEDSWWWFKRNSERVFNDAKTAMDRKAEVTVMWNRWRSQLFSWYPNIIALGDAGSWPYWSWRTITYYGSSIIVWLGFFVGLSWIRRRLTT